MYTRGRGKGGRGGSNSTGHRGKQQPEVGPDGKEINPYIPRYIANAPWYLEKSDDYLEHQRSHKDDDFKGEWYDRGKKPISSDATKFRKGACKNCGSMTHKATDCLERPRKIGAKYRPVDISNDEKIKEIKTTWDSKRDRWNGYDANEYKKVIEKFEHDETQKAILEEPKTNSPTDTIPEENISNTSPQRLSKDDEYGLDSLDNDDDDFSENEISLDKGSQKKDGALAPTTRSLRVREDKARYLQDLSEDAAVFNPKSRTLRTEEEGSINDRGQFIRKLTDKAEEHKMYTQLAEEAAERGENVHMEKGPTASLLLIQKYQKEKKESHDKSQKVLFDKYGGSEHFDKNLKEKKGDLLDDHFEYSQECESPSTHELQNLKKPELERNSKTKYKEDNYYLNHTSVWGSYWEDFQWGYACCHSLVKQSYCTGNHLEKLHSSFARNENIKSKDLNQTPLSSKRKLGDQN
ncbi:uncharacterized protein SAPINGB_P003890 [Magnusiomyces paraingens]|uniref:Pre-mRNA-splicing factor SLU7 n=1 Tax=Magnusiomyces paraingens TaxID=2606893 RepID=A0A5E8BX37_9ASCO|nr:uncharacterized protein SAPINGB_P003890 [Saprochaete ingens]VVT54067.1 unnamed protein product [Saprochaete ingens]